MISAGRVAVCVHFVAARGGLLGAKEKVSMKSVVELACQEYEILDRGQRKVFNLFCGGLERRRRQCALSKKRFMLMTSSGGYSIE